MKSLIKASGTASAKSGFYLECVGVLVGFGFVCFFSKKPLKLGDGPNCNFTSITVQLK